MCIRDRRWTSKTGYYLLMSLLNRVMKLRAGANDELIDNCELPYYMAASNVIFIQRKGQLNSANIPVSYTHLRHVEARASLHPFLRLDLPVPVQVGAQVPVSADAATAVSYTHLDVYKRQQMFRSVSA